MNIGGTTEYPSYLYIGWIFLFLGGIANGNETKNMILVKLKGRYEEWVKNGYFKPSEDKSKETYTIVIPPPNVTGKLHLGHAWDTTLQDIITRMKRMQGYDTLYLRVWIMLVLRHRQR